MASALKQVRCMRSTAVLLILLATATAGSAIGLAQQADRTEAPPQPNITFKSGVEAVTVSAIVRTQRGKVIKDLKKSDFELIDSGTARQINDFYFGDAAVSLGVLLDISGSMDVGGNMARAREAVNLALSNLQKDRDE